MNFNTVISIDIGKSGGISTFIKKEDKYILSDCIKTPIYKIETKPAKFKLKLDEKGKKQFYKTGSKKGEPIMVQTAPAKYMTELDVSKIFLILSSFENAVIVFEEPGSSVGNSAQVTATTHRNYGKMLALAELSLNTIVTVPANKWKKDLSLTKDKLECVNYAENLFGLSFKTNNNALLDGQAESALIGHWYIKTMNK